MTKEIQKSRPTMEAGAKVQAIVPRNIEGAYRMARSIFLSRMYPDSYAVDQNGKSGKEIRIIDEEATISRIMIGIQKAMEVGLAPITGLSTIYIVNNRPTVFGDGVPALLYGSGKIASIKEWVTGTWGNDDYTAHCSIKRKDSDEPIERSYSWGDAKLAKLTTKAGPWLTYPKRQLQMRARGFAARDGAADILSGLGIYEEVMDIPEPKQVIDTSSLDDDYDYEEDQDAVPALPEPDSSDLLKPLEFEDAEDECFAVPSSDLENKIDPDPLKEICLDCNGSGSKEFSDTDTDTGEVFEGIEPCPSCRPLKG
jgi:hypothetical protein